MPIRLLLAGLFIFVLYLPQAARCEEVGTQKVASKDERQVNIEAQTVQALSEAKQQIKVLEAQLAVTKEFHSSLLDTVYWALGGVFLVASLLLGFGWFANFKVYERDKDTLKSEIDSKFSMSVSDLSAQILQAKVAMEQSVRDLVEESAVRNKGELSKEFALTLKAVKGTVDAIDNRLFALELEKEKQEMERERSNAMALTHALHLLQLCARRAQDEVPDIIHFMLKKIELGGKFTANEITRVNAVLDILPGHYATLTEKLRVKLVASDIF